MDNLRAHGSALVRFVERYVKVDLRYLASGALWLTVGQFVASLSALILAIAFARFVPKEMYGTYKYALSLIGILSIATLPGINAYLGQAIARGAEGTLFTVLKDRIRWGLAGSVAGLLGAIYYISNGNTTLGAVLLIACLCIPFFETFGLFTVYLQAKKLFGQSIRYFTIVQLGSTAALLAVVYFIPSVIALVAAYILSLLVLRLFFFLRTIRLYKPNDVSDAHALKYGTHLSIIGILGQAVTYVDTVFLFHFFGPTAVALYSFAQAPIEQIRSLFTKNLPSLALPKLAARSMKEIDRMLVHRLSVLALLSVSICAVYFLAAPYVFTILFPAYRDAVPISQIIALLLVLYIPTSFLSSALQSKLHLMPPYWIYWGALTDTLHIIVLFALLPYGIYAVIAGRAVEILSAFILTLIQWKVLHDRERQRELIA